MTRSFIKPTLILLFAVASVTAQNQNSPWSGVDYWSGWNHLEVDFYGDDLLKIEVQDDNVKSQLVANSGTISAHGGIVAMTAAAALIAINLQCHLRAK